MNDNSNLYIIDSLPLSSPEPAIIPAPGAILLGCADAEQYKYRSQAPVGILLFSLP